MTTLRVTDAPIKLRIAIGDVLNIVAPPGSTAYVVHEYDLNPAATVTGTSQSFGPYTGTKTLTISCTAGAIDFSEAASSVPTSTGSVSKLITTKTLDSTDAGKVNEVAANATLTVTPGFGGCIVKVVNGTASVAFSGGATGNGATTTLTRAAYQMFTIDPNLTGSPNAFTVTGA